MIHGRKNIKKKILLRSLFDGSVNNLMMAHLQGRNM